MKFKKPIFQSCLYLVLFEGVDIFSTVKEMYDGCQLRIPLLPSSSKKKNEQKIPIDEIEAYIF